MTSTRVASVLQGTRPGGPPLEHSTPPPKLKHLPSLEKAWREFDPRSPRKLPGGHGEGQQPSSGGLAGTSHSWAGRWRTAGALFLRPGCRVLAQTLEADSAPGPWHSCSLCCLPGQAGFRNARHVPLHHSHPAPSHRPLWPGPGPLGMAIFFSPAPPQMSEMFPGA